MKKEINDNILIEKMEAKLNNAIFINELGSCPTITPWVGSFHYDKILSEHKKNYYYFIIYHLDEKIGILAIDLYYQDQQLEAIVMYALKKECQGKGYGTRVLSGITTYLLSLQVQQIHLYIDEKNTASLCIAQKNNYHHEIGKRYTYKKVK